MEGLTLSPFHRGPGLSFRVPQCSSAFMSGVSQALGSPAADLASSLQTHHRFARGLGCMQTWPPCVPIPWHYSSASLFLSSTQCPSERPQLIPTAGGGPPIHWLPPEFFCVPIATTTSMLVRRNGLSVLQPPPTEASHPSCCSRHPASPMEPRRALEAMSPGPAVAPPHSTGSVALARMERDHSHIGMWGKEKLGNGCGLRGRQLAIHVSQLRLPQKTPRLYSVL